MGIYSHVANWKNTLAKLGFAHKKSKNVGRRGFRSRRLRMESLESRQMLAVIHVTELVDENDHLITDGDVSLRDAIEQSATGDTIDFNPVIPNPNLNGGTISLLANIGEIAFSKSLTIDASMLSQGITIQGVDPDRGQANELFSNGSRIFNISDPTFGSSPPTVTLKHLTLTGGDQFGQGGAIRSEAPLVLDDCTIEANYAERGGGLFVSPFSQLASGTTVLEIKNSRLTGNKSTSVLFGNYGGGGGTAEVYATSDRGFVHVQNSQICNNTATIHGGGLFVRLEDSSTLLIESSTISGNMAGFNGGGILAEAVHDYTPPATIPTAITISNSLISGNTSYDKGGGIYTHNHSNTETLIESTQVSGNHVLNDNDGSKIFRNGGGVYAYLQLDNTQGPGKFTITGSTVDTNDTVREGGGIFVCVKGENVGTFVATNTTVAGNSAQDPTNGAGGGIYFARYGHTAIEEVDAYLRNVTINGNWSKTGGGVGILKITRMFVRIANSILSENFDTEAHTNKSNLAGPVVFADTQYDLIGTGTSVTPHTSPTGTPTTATIGQTFLNSTNIVSNSPGLDTELRDNGGPTLTMALISGSPAVDAGSNALAKDPLTGEDLTTDQRGPGFTRIFDVPGVGNAFPADVVDIGAYEVGLPKVIDVRIFGEDWAAGAPRYSAVEQVPLGKQLAPIGTDGVDTIEIHFSEDVLNTSTALTLYGTTQNNGFLNYGPNSISHSNVAYDDVTHVATWTFSSLPLDKYRIELSTAVTDVAGNALDGEWMNLTNGTFDDFADDPTGRTFLSGNGAPGAPNNVFRFFFSLLPGDSNQDGVVTSADTAGTIADVNGDGVGDNVDIGLINNGGTDVYTVVNANGLLDTWLPLRIFEGDYVDDELVRNNSNTASDPLSASHDYDRWQLTVNTPILDADGNGDGSVDAADYVVYANNRYDYSGWYVETPPSSGSGSGSSISQVGVAPQVINVLISGSNSVHSAFSFAEVVGSGDQLGTVPVGGADTVEITFSEPVNVTADMLRFQGLHFGERPALVDFSYDASTQTARWQFAPITKGDHYLIALSDAITDTDGEYLDGEWVNPNSIFTTNTAVSVFPSGDGYAGGDFNFVVTILPGDANLDGQVNSADTSIFLTSLWSYLTPALFTDGDFNGSGGVTRDDLPLIAGNYGVNLQTLGIRGDLNGDLKVDDSDREILYDNWSNGLQNPTHDDGDLRRR